MEALQHALVFIIPGLSKGLVYALIGLGFVVTFKCTGIFNLAMGEILMLSGYVFYLFANQLGLPVWAAVMMTLVLMCIIGYITVRLMIQPLVGQPNIAMILMTLAMGSILVALMILFWGSQDLIVPRFFPRGGIDVYGSVLEWHYIGFALVSLVLLLALLAFFRYSKLGLSMMSISEDQQAAQALGISVTRIVQSAWILGILAATVGGIILTSVTAVQYSQASIGMIGMAVALCGGLQSLGGVIVGGLLVGLIQGLVSGYVDPFVPGSLQEVSAYIIMMLVLLIRPTGIFGWERIERV
ncbi:MAG: branched-chain amino acid ABC transporter permease [Dehalococcoidia bacterium]|nr:branched-chain amino acid ABC transporter permease [Dehalococcoidia bacterium]